MTRKNSIIVILIFSISLVVVILLTLRSKNTALKQNFNGIVEKVSIYGGKRNVRVKLENKASYLLDLYSIKEVDEIEVGDSLFKAENELDLYHYKWNDAKMEYELEAMHSFSSFLD